MRRLIGIAMIVLVVACSPKKKLPDVSDIPMPLTLQRFDRDFFAMDTLHISTGLDSLQKKYPVFIKDYLYNILSAYPQPDSVLKDVLLFRRTYAAIDSAAQQQFPNFKKYTQQIATAFRYFHYYFPKYNLPHTIITYIGPIEGVGCALTSSGLAIGLQAYLGHQFPAYHTRYISEVYPDYETRRFEPQYITVNCLRNILSDFYPEKKAGTSLIEQMIESGKRLYVLNACLPNVADSIKTGYTQAQLNGCYEHEKNIWHYFIQNNLLYETEPTQIASYVNDGPGTPELGSAAPSNIGQFTGWQIVKQWMKKYPEKTLEQLLSTPAKQIFDEAKYQP